MLPEADLPLRLVERGAYFDYLGPQDEPWLRVLLAEMARFEGEPVVVMGPDAQRSATALRVACAKDKRLAKMLPSTKGLL